MSSKKEYIHYLIALALGCLLFFFLKPTNGLTEMGVRVIAVIVPTLYLWLTTNTHWTCFMVLGLLVITQAMTANEVWANSMGHFIFITIMTYMLLNICLTETGVINKIAIFFITRSFVKGRPLVFLGMFILSHLFLGFFVNGVSLCAIYIGIAEEIARNLKTKKGEPMYTALMLGILQGNCLVACCSPIGNALPNLIISLLKTTCGIEITYTQWMGFGIIFTLVSFVAMMIIMRIWNPDTTPFKNYDIDEMRKNNKPLDKAGKISAAVLILVVAIVIVPTLFNSIPFFKYISDLGVALPAIIGVVILCLIHVDGKPVMDLPRAMTKLNLPSVVFAGTVACLAVPISSDNTGITKWLSNILSPMLSGVSTYLVILVLVILAILMTNFLSNTVTEALFFNIGAALLATTNYNMAAFAIIIAMASGMSTITPSAAVPSPFFFGPGHLTMKDTIKPNLAFVLATFIIILAVAIPLANVIV